MSLLWRELTSAIADTGETRHSIRMPFRLIRRIHSLRSCRLRQSGQPVGQPDARARQVKDENALPDRADGEARDETVEEEVVENGDRDARDEAGRHQRAPEVDVPAHQ